MTLKFALALAFCTIAFSAFAQNGDSQVELIVPAHDIARGAVIAEGDLDTKSVPVLRANDSLIRKAADVTGREAKRALRAGEFLRASDFKRPTLVAKGATVTMLFDAPGMSLSAVGRALAEGGEGDSIAVLNPTSYRQVVGVVMGPGIVRVGKPDPAAPQPARKVATANNK
jgi:flagella basal body P-ring formation protein FlgA